MADQKTAHAEIDWSTAEVRDGGLAVEFAGEPTAQWAKHVAGVIDRLERHAGRWGTIKVTKDRLAVTEVVAGSEADLRHFLEGVVQQANADFAPEPEDETDDGGGSDADREMTEAFRSFSSDGDAGEQS